MKDSGNCFNLSYQLLYSETSRKQIRKLHPQFKPIVKSKIEELQEKPFIGKWIVKKLSGYLSTQAKRFRVIYKIRNNDQTVEIHQVGHRKDIYELFRGAIAK
jgi:mRNA-degrading endonuclease RelE of RelBE toxin-antitoxin system